MPESLYKSPQNHLAQIEGEYCTPIFQQRKRLGHVPAIRIAKSNLPVAPNISKLILPFDFAPVDWEPQGQYRTRNLLLQELQPCQAQSWFMFYLKDHGDQPRSKLAAGSRISDGIWRLWLMDSTGVIWIHAVQASHWDRWADPAQLVAEWPVRCRNGFSAMSQCPPVWRICCTFEFATVALQVQMMYSKLKD